MKNINRKAIMQRAHEIARGLVGQYCKRLATALRQAWAEAKNTVKVAVSNMKKFAGYHVDGSKANNFKTDAMKLFSNPELKKELQWRITNLNRETMSFDLDARLNCPKEIMELAKKHGVGFNSYA